MPGRETEMATRDTAYIVLDMDWACDAVLEDTIELIQRLDIRVTLYITHATPVLAKLRGLSSMIELGIHPNFNDLLQGTLPTGTSTTARQRVEEMMKLVPEARSVRSHSLTTTSWLNYVFADAGLTHEVNTYLPLQAGMNLRAWRNWDGRLIRVPFLFEDSLQEFMADSGGWSVEKHLKHAGMRVLNFHPIRLFLNAKDAQLPQEAAPARQTVAGLAAHRRDSAMMGSRAFLEQFVQLHRSRGGDFATISSIQP